MSLLDTPIAVAPTGARRVSPLDVKAGRNSPEGRAKAGRQMKALMGDPLHRSKVVRGLAKSRAAKVAAKIESLQREIAQLQVTLAEHLRIAEAE